MVPPVAIKSSSSSTRWPSLMWPTCISIVSLPYSRLYDSEIVSPGSFPGLRKGTNAQLSARAKGAPKIRPRASKPARDNAAKLNDVSSCSCYHLSAYGVYFRARAGAERQCLHASGQQRVITVRTGNNVNFLIFVALCKRISRCLEHLRVQQQCRYIPEQNSGLGEIGNAPQVVRDELTDLSISHFCDLADVGGARKIFGCSETLDRSRCSTDGTSSKHVQWVNGRSILRWLG